jgi:small subunit ribosomal protein S5
MSFKSSFTSRRVPCPQGAEMKESVVFINRTAKVVKGGRRFGFTALVVTGDGAGHVGFGLGKSGEVPIAITKGGEQAKKSMVKVPLQGTTIPHDVIGKFGPTKVVLLPGKPGTGVIAGAAVRAVAEAAGIKDIRTKVIGSNNPNNVLAAAFEGLLRLRTPETVAKGRGVPVNEVGYQTA